MKILFCAAECSPFVKVGGLGDVMGALPKTLAARGHDVAVVMPYYDEIDTKFGHEVTDVMNFFTYVGWRHQYVGVKLLKRDGVSYYFLDNQYYFFRGHVYGDYDDGERFAYFQQAAMEMMEKVDFIPDVVHVNDYHTAMIPFLLKEKYNWIHAYHAIRTVLTIHNLEFQGQYDAGTLWDLFGVGPERYYDGTVRWNNQLNWLKTGILYADRVTTVSPSYAEEIKTAEFGKGLDQILRMESGKLSGITNGIDTQIYNPATDKYLTHHFSAEDMSGKVLAKEELQRRMNLPVRSDIPVIGIVSRLTDQKGFDLIVSELNNLVQYDVQLVVLGTGYPQYEHAFRYFADTYTDKVSASIAFDLSLAQLIYAGSDMFLMPSAFEPCGLSQMMAMRYGTIPIVHEVGGLKDTVQPYNEVDNTGTGFSFAEFSGYWMMQTILHAMDLYKNDPDKWGSLVNRAMNVDFSWSTASQAYEDMYRSLKA
ncbi:glycogen synthase GlgA [Alloscardovia venturai]|uniref:Glycogen synthase n=1 Tax=Alloscardovia venturai TaxID=1769421 RepID=A0ABW2Y8C3_9BIFI